MASFEFGRVWRNLEWNQVDSVLSEDGGTGISYDFFIAAVNKKSHQLFERNV